MVEQKQNVTEEMLLKEMERRGAPYAGKPVWNRATEERASAALDLMRECLGRVQEASDRGERPMDAVPFR